MNDLSSSNPLLPPDSNSSRALEVVPVHDDVDKQVQGNWNPRDRSVTNELSVAKKGSSSVVIRVQKGQWLSSQKQKDGIDKFNVLGNVVEVVDEKNFLSPSLIRADCVKDSVVEKHRENLFKKKYKQKGGDDGQGKIVDLEEELQFYRVQVKFGHNVSSSKNSRVVKDEHCNDFWERP